MSTLLFSPAFRSRSCGARSQGYSSPGLAGYLISLGATTTRCGPVVFSFRVYLPSASSAAVAASPVLAAPCPWGLNVTAPLTGLPEQVTLPETVAPDGPQPP